MRRRQRAIDDLRPAKAEAQEAQRLRMEMEDAEKDPAITPAIADYVRKTLAFGMCNVQTEFRPLARRNWRLIRKYGQRFGLMFAVLFLALIGLGIAALNASNRAADASHEARHNAHTASVLSRQAAHLSQENAKRIAEGQAIRRNAVLSACHESNEHHHAAEGFVAQLVAASQQPQTPAEVARRERLVPLFVEAIAPRCTKRQLRERLSRVRPHRSRTDSHGHP